MAGPIGLGPEVLLLAVGWGAQTKWPVPARAPAAPQL